MISLRDVTIARGARILAANVDLTLYAGERVGIVGANGCGKSSLLALIGGDIEPEAGEVHMPPALKLARVSQETPAVASPAIEYVLDGDSELRGVEAAIAQAEARGRAEDVAALHERLQEIDGYAARSRAAALLHGLGFGTDRQRAPVASFSGGWRMRLNLARALIARSDAMLLDEPTNHLDLDAIVWLERWLTAYPGTLLVVSHDRDFLDATVRRVLHFERGSIAAYAGNYSEFEQARAVAASSQQAAYARQQREIAHLRSFVDRFRAKATKARQAQSRLKALARMELIAPAHVDSEFQFRFEPPAAAPSPLVALEAGSVAYDDRVVLSEIEMSVMPGSRIALLGRNGAGKSTLVKALAGDLPLAGGKRVEGRGLAIGYFAQHLLEQLRDEDSALEHLARVDPAAREQELRDFLGRFGFAGDHALAVVGRFSGGERARLALALMVRARPNLLLLDEPTNHLDIEMRAALTLALQEYEGAVVLVSHDRHLVRTTADELWHVADGRASPFDGDLEDYRALLSATSGPAAEDDGPAHRGRRKDDRRERARRQDELAARRRPLEAEAAALEAELAALGRERGGIDAALASQATYRAGEGGDMTLMYKRRAQIEQRMDDAELRWLELQEQLEAMQMAALAGGARSV